MNVIMFITGHYQFSVRKSGQNMKKSTFNRLFSLVTITTMLLSQPLYMPSVALGANISDFSEDSSSLVSSIEEDYSTSDNSTTEYSVEDQDELGDSASNGSGVGDDILILDDSEKESLESQENQANSEDSSLEASSLGSSLEDEALEASSLGSSLEDDEEELPDDYYEVFPTGLRGDAGPKVESSSSGAGFYKSGINSYNILKSSSLPSYYVTPNLPALRQQSPYGTCWAFSSTALAEISIMKNHPDYSADFSELHLAYFTYNSVVDPLGGTSGDYFTIGAGRETLDMGGSVEAAMNSFARWVGVAEESTADYVKDANTAINPGLDPSLAYSADVAHVVNYYIDLVDKDQSSIDTNKHNNIKQLVHKYGAVTISFAAASSTSGATKSKLYNSKTNAYYNPTYSMHNHSVTIVGWDDNFSKSNFTQTPPGDGAFLIRNSWKNGDGTSVDKNQTYTGYFWMSYYEATLGAKVVAAEFDFTGDYDNNYVYDAGYYNANTTDNKVANVFTAHADGAEFGERIEAVSFETAYSNASYEINVYTDLTNPNNPESGTLSATMTGSNVYAGFYTINLPSPVYVSPGDTFSVVVSLSKPGETPGISEEFQFSSDPAGVSAEKGQSFKYNSKKKTWEDAVTANGSKNYAVKAYTTNATEAESGPTIIDPKSLEFEGLDSDALTMGLKEKVTLKAKVLPEDATNQNVLWTSSDESVVSVSDSGVLTGLSLGTAKITATVEDTDVAKEITVTVVSVTSIEMYRLLDGKKTSVPSQSRRIDSLTFTAVVSTWNDKKYNTGFEWKNYGSAKSPVYAKVSPVGAAKVTVDSDGNLNIAPVNKCTVTFTASSLENPDFTVSKSINFKPYTVSYVLGDGTQNPDNPTYFFVGETKELLAPECNKQDYNFEGWYTDKSFSESSRRDSVLPSDNKNLTFYAKYELSTAILPPVKEEVPELHIVGPDNVAEESYELPAQDTLQLSAVFVTSKDIQEVTSDLTWIIKESSVKGVASIDDKGVLTAAKEGWVKVAAKAATDKSSTGYVESKPVKISVYVPMESAELSKSAVTMAPGASYTVEALLTPAVLGANSGNTVTGKEIGSDVSDSIRWKLLNESDEGYLQLI